MRLVLLLLAATALFGQTRDFITGGVFYNQAATPNLSGFLAYAQNIQGGAYSYTAVDVTSADRHSFRPQTSLSTGLALSIRQLGRMQTYALLGAGVAMTNKTGGTNLGGSFTGGAMGVIPVKAGWSIVLPVRILHTTIVGTQYVAGIGVGWGR